MGNRELTFETVCGLMNRWYTLMYVDYRDSLDGHLDLIQKCIEEESAEKLFSHLDDWFIDAEDKSVCNIINKLKNLCISSGFGKRTVKEFFTNYEESIIDEIHRRDDSNPIKDLLRNTADIPVRIELHSNHYCINSHQRESQTGYWYEQSYFGDMVNALKLNPAKVKESLLSHGYQVYGAFPNKAYRNGRELVGYDDFYTELINSCCGVNLLVFTGKINPSELYENNFSIDKITVPKGNCCGIFSSMYGSGSIIEMELRRDVTLNLHAKKYGYYDLQLDLWKGGDYNYSIRETYGLDTDFFKSTIKINK